MKNIPGAENSSERVPIWFIEQCERFSRKKLFTFHRENDEKDFLTGRDLADKAKVISQYLQRKLAPGEKVILILPQGLDYICGLLACFDANVIAIPTPITDLEQQELISEKVGPILKDSNAACILTDSHFKAYLEAKNLFGSVPLYNIQELFSENYRDAKARTRNWDDIALLLYTSGSTSQPKGVMLSHGNVRSQAAIGAFQWGISEDSRIVSWMPQFHNFGLFLNILTPLISGASSVIMSPGSFIGKPEDWLMTISRHQATHTGAPNFAFDYCCSAMNQEAVPNLSLHSLQGIICGGEPVRKETYENFQSKFKTAGLGDNVFCPHYGMSETGSLTTLRPGTPMRFLFLDIPSLELRKVKFKNQDKKSKSVTSCGEIDESTQLVIVNPDNCQPCPVGEIGEIWVKSPSVAVGYLNRKQETGDSFSGTLSLTKESDFFRTGDLGFIEDNHLYIVGREKEVIIIHGKNHHPVDIEWTIKKYVPSLSLPVSVFSCDIEEQEKVVVVQEVEVSHTGQQPKNFIQSIIAAVSENHGLELYTIQLVAKGSIPRTGSGKIQRKACRNAYLNQTLSVVYQYRQGDVVSPPPKEDSPALFDQEIIQTLKQAVFLPVLKSDSPKITEASSLSELGLDSIQYVRISRKIEEVFQIQFPPVLFFKHRSFENLAGYIRGQIAETPVPFTASRLTGTEPLDFSGKSRNEDIAIIGVSCHFPGGAVDPESFWEILLAQKDCITSFSQSRPEILTEDQRYYGGTGESFPEWGGFIGGVDQFDAAFFNISPLEAESMDPQQRKLLELTWSVIEDGGYNPLQIAGEKIGLFVGVHNNDYADLVMRRPELMKTYGAYLDSGLHFGMIANRVSRWFDFHGPSEIVNTACSSSLVAVHHAVRSIQQGESNLAIAAGINIILTSRVHRACHRGGMLSKDGRCKTFDRSANGIVRSEGYGALLLKPYGQAVRDGDPIYGMIKKAVINHDGQSNSLRAPNMNAQRELIKSTYEDPNRTPETVSYIETHGTGTSLGDPIEIQALREAFQEINPKIPDSLCGLGTAKTNIGHCESASGIAGVIKVLMSMKHQTLPGIIHFNQLNPYIHLKNSPFYIVEKNQEWNRRKDSGGRDIPNRAGISSFGLGGVNAHVVVEEYIPSVTEPSISGIETKEKTVIIPISAKTKQCLRSSVQKLQAFLRRSEVDLLKAAYTLQTGRAAMEERIVFVISGIPELLQKMTDFEQGKEPIGNCWQGYMKQQNPESSESGEETRELIRKWVAQGERGLGKVAQHWSQGGAVDWNLLYGEIKPHRIHLPTYSFAKERYWLPENRNPIQEAIPTNALTFIHPLLQQNTSNLSGLRFSSIFNGREFFLADHLVKGERILPGVTYLEMARAAVIQAVGGMEESGTTIRLKNIVWTRFIRVGAQPVRVNIGLFPESNGEIAYEVSCETEKSPNDPSVDSRGRAELGEKTDIPTLDLSSVKAGCNQSVLFSTQVYEAFKKAGILYGPGHQGIKELYIGKGKILAQLSLPESLSTTKDQYFLHPSIMDSALQAFIGLKGFDDPKLALPFAMEELEIIDKSTSSMWAYLRIREDQPIEGETQQIDIDLCDDQGMIRVRMKGVSFKAAEEKAGLAETMGTLMLEPVWRERNNLPPTEIISPDYSRHLVILCEMPVWAEKRIAGEMPEVRCIHFQSERPEIEKRFQSYACQALEEIQRELSRRQTGKVLVQIVVPRWGEGEIFQGLAGLLKTAGIENPKFVGQVIAIEDPVKIIETLRENSSIPDDGQIRYCQGQRYVLEWNEMEKSHEKGMMPWKDRGIYLITGGAGGLGMIFAREIADQAKDVNLILTGRSPLSAEKQNRIQELEALGAKVVYKSVDVSNREAVNGLIRSIREEFKGLDGIIHSAGVIKDNYIIKKSPAEVEEVLAPKVAGLVNIDQASRDLQLDLVILFSSIAGSLGNAGQADYSMANAFMDAYAEYRNRLVESGQRQGWTLSVNWPLWKDGGMHMEAETAKMMMENTGMVAMESSAGIQALYEGFSSGKSRMMVLEGRLERLKHRLTPGTTATENAPADSKGKNKAGLGVLDMGGDALREKTENYLKNLISKAINLPAGRIPADAPFEEYGIDSVMMLELNVRLEKIFGTLSQTLFYEYQTLKDLTGYFLEAHRDRLLSLPEIENE